MALAGLCAAGLLTLFLFTLAQKDLGEVPLDKIGGAQEEQAQQETSVKRSLARPWVAWTVGGALFFGIGVGVSAPVIGGRFDRELKEGR